MCISFTCRIWRRDGHFLILLSIRLRRSLLGKSVVVSKVTVSWWLILDRRIAGWTALQYPWNERPISEDLKAVVNSHDIPPLPKGANPEAVMELFRCLGFASDHGYSMETDYRTFIGIWGYVRRDAYICIDRKGTMIHPDFQKRGFGTALTKHVNAISDKTGGRVFAPALRSSRKMFLDNGFKAVGVHDAHLERWGGSREESITTMVLREPPIAELA